MNDELLQDSRDFNKRLSQWVASQGFWFQIRYSITGRGLRGRALYHTLRIGLRLLIVAILGGVGLGVWLFKNTESPKFRNGMSSALKQRLSTGELVLHGVQYNQGNLEISRLAAEGAQGSFFESLEAVSLRCRMNLLESVLGKWDPGVMSVASINVDLRAGTDDQETAAALGEALFQPMGRFQLNAIEVGRANLRWGYSKRTEGQISDSVMRIQNTVEGWRLTFKGGTFRQNWLKDLEIVSIVALLEPSGIRFTEAEFRQGQGSLDFSGLRVIAGSRPRVEGVARLQNLDLEKLLPRAATDFVEGSISGEFRVFGSTNSAQGIGYEGEVILDGNDQITLRDTVPLLTALSVMDYSRNYHRVDFGEGSFRLRTEEGGMKLSDISLIARLNDAQKTTLFTMEGDISVRQPTRQEIQQAIGDGSAGDDPLLVRLEREGVLDSMLLSGETEFSLKRAAIEAERERKGLLDPGEYTLFDRLSLNAELRELEMEATERMARILQYEGECLISLPGDAFERAGELREVYPVDEQSGRIAIEVPIKGSLYEITTEQSEMIYARGRRP